MQTQNQITLQIPFNKPYYTGNETNYMAQAMANGKISGGGEFTKRCHDFFKQKYGFENCLLTNSCTAALEMAAILIDIKPGDEVIMPSYTFVSTANAFVLRGAKIVFADSSPSHPNMDVDTLEHLITPKTRAIVPVHYAGNACIMEAIIKLADKHNLYIIEDAAQAIDGYYIFTDGSRKPLGSIGHLAAFSFHDTKNIICGEGGLLVINDKKFVERAEIIWEKGTDRSKFIRGETNSYGWVDIGSSFLPSELTAAFLLAQLEQIEQIQNKRLSIWNHYNSLLANTNFETPTIPLYSTNNAQMYYIVLDSIVQRNNMIALCKKDNIQTAFHYLPLHQSEFYTSEHDGRNLPNCQRFADGLLRLPLYYDMGESEVEFVVDVGKSLGL
ncbi:MAG: dTDP-4-amino-4,6-dideoxygalactose transaminase [Bacteroidota bacterium]|nr:dTDP-4-amino-4,6-dideoxygalactose transaminase [Bacteroidota bacterium]